MKGFMTLSIKNKKEHKMTKKSTFWIGILWAPISMGLMIVLPNFFTFAIFMVGALVFFNGEERQHTTYNYRLAGPESHTHTINGSPFFYGYGITGSVLILTWIGWLIIQALTL